MADEYISRNAVIERLEERKSSVCPSEPWEYERYRDICDAIDSDIDTVQNIPSADVSPIVHARWIDLDEDCLCSACGAPWWYKENCTGKFRFCPNCGAKMDLE